MLPLETRSLLTRLASHLYDSDLDVAWEMYIKRIEETNSLPHTADFMFFLLDQGQISPTQYHQLNEVISEKTVVLDTEPFLNSPDILIQVPEPAPHPADPKLLNDDQTITAINSVPEQAQISNKQLLSGTDSQYIDELNTLGPDTREKAVIDGPDSLWKKSLRALAFIASKFY